MTYSRGPGPVPPRTTGGQAEEDAGKERVEKAAPAPEREAAEIVPLEEPSGQEERAGQGEQEERARAEAGQPEDEYTEEEEGEEQGEYAEGEEEGEYSDEEYTDEESEGEESEEGYEEYVEETSEAEEEAPPVEAPKKKPFLTKADLIFLAFGLLFGLYTARSCK
ncbi:MAG: hypothetical protein Q8P50_04275 [Bacillota bacterium]|nr:hypothetical protein [Bacillota bacterium]